MVMKVVKKEESGRKLVAVIGNGPGIGFYARAYPSYSHPSVWIGGSGVAPESRTLEELVKVDSSREPVYEGDTVEITF